MRKILGKKHLLLMLVLVVLLILPGKFTYADEAAPVKPGNSGIVTAYVLYENEEIEVNSTQPVYYAVLKKATDTTVKPTELVEAARKGTYDLYYIDVSTLAPGKDAYVGISNTNTPNSDGVVEVVNVPVRACTSKAEFNLFYAAEEGKAKGRDLVYSVVVTNPDKTVVTYDHSGKNNDTVKDINNLPIQWRKGTNCDWKDIDELKKVDWDAMKNSGALIYFRIGAINQTGQKEGQRYSKEYKVKLAITKAPTIKLDVNKLSLGLKNGMQFKLVQGDALSWQTVLPMVNDSNVEEAVRNPAAKTLYDPYTEGTKTKKTSVSLDKIFETLAIAAPEAGKTVAIEYRIAATTKKPASMSNVIIIPYQCEAPTGSLGVDPGIIKLSSVMCDPEDKTLNPAYEYIIVLENDLTKNDFDMETAKWAAIKQGGVIKVSAKSAYVTKSGLKRTVSIGDIGAVMLLRRKGISGGNKKEDILASKYVKLEIPAGVSASPTPKPTAAPANQ